MNLCQQLRSSISELVDGELADEQAAILKAHTQQCPPCAEFADTYRDSTESCRCAMLKRIPAELEDRLLGFLRRRCSAKSGEPSSG